VINRDRTCRICETDKNLEAHHIKSFKEFLELRYDINNGITLCEKCHFENPNYDPVTTLVKN
jgi:5-methylcytosine-specific restriction endonuclease McrA